jgi:multicomponent Na+:H+ antiporter subunit D
MSAGMIASIAVLVPFAGAVPIAFLGGRPNAREAVTLITATVLFAIVVSLIPTVLSGARPDSTWFDMLPGVPLRLTIEPLGMTFAVIASFLWIVNSIYSIGYMRGNQEHDQTRFYVCFAVALGSTIGVAFAGNMLTLFVFYEILTLSTYPLVTHKGNREAVMAGRTYLGILLSTSIGLLLLAILWTWVATGTLDFRPGGILGGKVGPALLGILLFLYMYGIGKAALMPIHRWLPAAMVAPTPVSALLHAVAVVKAGVFTVVKVIVYIFGIETLRGSDGGQVLLYAAGFTIIVASVIALREDNLKRRLAYSTVSQLSYVILAAAILTPISLVGAPPQTAAHAFGKITLFFAAGSIYTASHKTEISQLPGIGRRMPWTMTAFFVGSLSMIGVPPTFGFVSKWFIIQGAFAADQMVALAVIIVSTLLNAAYFLPIVYSAFLRDPSEARDAGTQDEEHGEAPLPIVIALTATAAGTVILFFAPSMFIDLARQLIGGTP